MKAQELVARFALLLVSLGIFALYGLLLAYDPKADDFVGVASAAELVFAIVVLAAAVVPWGD